MGDSEKANALEDRLIDFAVRVIKVADALPESPAPKDAESRGAKSNADFVHKLKIALNETKLWLRMACLAGPMKQERLMELIDENQQLCRIQNASVKTAKQIKAD